MLKKLILNKKTLQKDFDLSIGNLINNLTKLKREFNKKKIKIIIIDDFIPLKYPKYYEKNFYKPNFDTDLKSKKNQIGKHIVNSKNQSKSLSKNDLFLKNLFYKKKFITFLKKLTEINDLQKDKNEWGSGFHQTVNKGFLNKHLDPTFNSDKKLIRRLNVLYYFNSNWKKKYKGYLSIWNSKLQKKPSIYIEPKINRLVIFETSSFSWHGHPEPLKVPKNKTRKSLSLFFFSKKKGKQNLKNFDAEWN